MLSSVTVMKHHVFRNSLGYIVNLKIGEADYKMAKQGNLINPDYGEVQEESYGDLIPKHY